MQDVDKNGVKPRQSISWLRIVRRSMRTFESRLREPEGSKAIIIKRVALNLAEQHEAEKDVET